MASATTIPASKATTIPASTAPVRVALPPAKADKASAERVAALFV